MQWFRPFGLVIALVLLMSGSAEGQAPDRVALVIANSSYASAGRLTNPRRDASLIADALRKAGFRTVVVREDLGLRDFQLALRDFQAQAARAEVALVYYAGHGIEGKGKNWLIPIDAQLGAEAHLDFEAIPLDSVMGVLEEAKLRVVILDACRNNPFSRSWTRSTRSVSRGFRATEPDLSGTLIMYAAAAGDVASDGAGSNSPFAAALARRLQEPGLPILSLGASVRDDVLTSTGNVQRPFIYSSLSARPYFLVPGPSGTTTGMSERDRDYAVFAAAQSINSIPALEDYLRRFPRGENANLARGLLAGRYQAEARRTSSAASEGREFIVYYPFDQHILTPEAVQVVRDAVAHAKAQPYAARILLRSFTSGDWPSEEAAQLHTERQNKSVIDLLVAEGISSDRIFALGLGRGGIGGVREPLQRMTEIEVIPY